MVSHGGGDDDGHIIKQALDLCQYGQISVSSFSFFKCIYYSCGPIAFLASPFML